ncbi:hypothetical protein CDL15_Pgr022410 [Punica granatum]|nr:hypothetical protein CDL15_Pgr022410 [Punica granatum]
MLSIGILLRMHSDSCSDKGECSVDRLAVLWVAYRLWHLGGPNSITAYSSEDSSLWPRNSPCIAAQGGASMYILIRDWSSELLSNCPSSCSSSG